MNSLNHAQHLPSSASRLQTRSWNFLHSVIGGAIGSLAFSAWDSLQFTCAVCVEVSSSSPSPRQVLFIGALLEALSSGHENLAFNGSGAWADGSTSPLQVFDRAHNGWLDAMTMITRPLDSSHTDLCLAMRARVFGPWSRLPLVGGFLAHVRWSAGSLLSGREVHVVDRHLSLAVWSQPSAML